MEKSVKKTLIIAASSVAAVVVAAVVWWLWSRRRNGGLAVIAASTGNVNQTTNSSATMTPTATPTSAELQAQFANTSLPRGYRNNNPLNVRKNAANLWKGKVVPGTDPAFEQFVSMAYGYRCALYLLRKYVKQGNNTIRKIVSKWAPPSENNTGGYINNVATRTGINADITIAPTDREALCKIAWAMAWSENGKAPATMADIYSGWALL